ncbi:hypothetical protein D9611_009583 [Ephemerocybe angulata]|uniref:Uncharacterized protein n=1 Tax=Ephemerocybe angulata TaxID=980116 RepID=A0A8H5C626_9AGAR|nr:hypothetical protein D9611_009583 [Tulosesus angulatus]
MACLSPDVDLAPTPPNAHPSSAHAPSLHLISGLVPPTDERTMRHNRRAEEHGDGRLSVLSKDIGILARDIHSESVKNFAPECYPMNLPATRRLLSQHATTITTTAEISQFSYLHEQQYPRWNPYAAGGRKG